MELGLSQELLHSCCSALPKVLLRRSGVSATRLLNLQQGNRVSFMQVTSLNIGENLTRMCCSKVLAVALLGERYM